MHRYYECNICKGKFSRKWNALRHNDKVHYSSATIFNNQKGNISQTNNHQKENSNSDFQGMSEGKDDKLLEFCKKLIKPIELLEQLSDTDPEGERNKFIAKMITTSMMSSNPIKTLYDAIDQYKAVRGKKKILNYVAKYNNMTLFQAELYLNSQISTNGSVKLTKEL